MNTSLSAKKIENDGIEIYIKYVELDTRDLLNLLDSIELLYKSVVTKSPRNSIGLRIQVPPHSIKHRLVVHSINTGSSIRFKFTEGLVPSVKISTRDIDINIPKKLGIPIVVVYLLLGAANEYYDLKNKQLDTRSKELEIEIKELELYEELNKKGDMSSDSTNLDFLREEANKSIEVLQNSESIKYFELNGVPIKELKF